MLRFVGRNDLEISRPWLSEWVPVVAGWLTEGRTPYVFMHSPNDLFAPSLARLFHQELSKLIPDLPLLPVWPGEIAAQNQFQQRELF